MLASPFLSRDVTRLIRSAHYKLFRLVNLSIMLYIYTCIKTSKYFRTSSSSYVVIFVFLFFIFFYNFVLCIKKKKHLHFFICDFVSTMDACVASILRISSSRVSFGMESERTSTTTLLDIRLCRWREKWFVIYYSRVFIVQRARTRYS